ncbi:MAG: hypothetical protein IT360_24240 [Gemmatimonadaceae bacterium]|nr:hypothetical protein [Gemmatimonadaceae bacterium]
MHEASVVVIAAQAMGETVRYRGTLHGTVGVVSTPGIARSAVSIVALPDGRCRAASPYPRPIDGVPLERNPSGVSFAVANASDVIARALEAGAPATPVEGLLDWIEARTVPAPPQAD